MSQDDCRRVRRILRQRLESLQRAGVSLLPRAPDAVGTARASEADGYGADAGSPVDDSRSPPADVGTEPAGHQPLSLFPETSPSPPQQAVEPAMERSNLSRDQRTQKLQALCECVAACTKCSELAATRTQTAFGVGDPQAAIMFVGEAPGAEEDKQGIPFVGRAGQLLDRIIAACKMKREEVYICNILRCRPPGNRNPTPEEAGNCREFLDAQIEIVDPDYIICLGAVAAGNLLETKTSIGRLRGKFFSYGRAKVACTYHPSYLLRNPAAKKDVWGDMKFVMADMGVELD